MNQKKVLDRWTKLRARRGLTERKMEATLEELVGSEIRFRRGDMVAAAPAIVLRVQWRGTTLRIRNLLTDRERTIDASEVVTQ